MTDQRSSPSQMINAGTRMRSDPLLAERMGVEEGLGADAGAGNAGQPTAPESPLVPDAADVDDWDGMDMDGAEGDSHEGDSPEGGAEGLRSNPNEVETVPLDTLSQSDAANDNWDDNDDNPYNDSDDALPDDSEEAAVDTDLLNTTERGRFGDADPGPNRRTDEGD